MYQNLVFDLYGTLADVWTADDSMDVFRKLAKFYTFRGAKYTAAELRDEFRRGIDGQVLAREGGIYGKTGETITYPEIDVLPIYARLFEEKGVSADGLLAEVTANWHRIAMTRKLRVYPGVFALFRKWKRQGRRLYLLSNAQRVYTAGELETTGLRQWFDGILISSDYGCRKPDPIFFGELKRQFGILPEESIMIGNEMRSDIAGACAAGMDSVLLVTNAALAAPSDGIRYTYIIEDGDFRKLNRIPGLE